MNFWKNVAIFSEIHDDQIEFATKFLFRSFSGNLWPKGQFLMPKNCNEIFWIGNDPSPPPLQKFSKKSSIFVRTAFPYMGECKTLHAWLCSMGLQWATCPPNGRLPILPHSPSLTVADTPFTIHVRCLSKSSNRIGTCPSAKIQWYDQKVLPPTWQNEHVKLRFTMYIARGLVQLNYSPDELHFAFLLSKVGLPQRIPVKPSLAKLLPLPCLAPK